MERVGKNMSRPEYNGCTKSDVQGWKKHFVWTNNKEIQTRRAVKQAYLLSQLFSLSYLSNERSKRGWEKLKLGYSKMKVMQSTELIDADDVFIVVVKNKSTI